jgi:hypothetical protein
MSLVIVLTAKTSWGAIMAPKRAIALLTPRPTFLKWMNEWMNEWSLFLSNSIHDYIKTRLVNVW